MRAGPEVATDHDVVAACTRVLFDYAAHLDLDLGEGCAECFAADGVWRAPYAELRGREAIRSFFEQRPPGIRTRHLWTNLSFDLSDPARPSCTACVQVPRMDLDRPDQGVETLLIDARDTFVNEAGRWLILLHDCNPAFPTTASPAAAETERHGHDR